RRVERAWRPAAIYPPDRPGGRRRVVGAQRGAARIAAGPVEQVVLDVAEAAEHRTRVRRALHLVPLAVRTLDALMHSPVAKLEVEVVRAGEIVGGVHGE